MRINESIYGRGRYDGESMFDKFIFVRLYLHETLALLIK